MQVAEYAQKAENKIDMNGYPLGKGIVKAFLPTDWIFKDKNDRIIKKHPSGETCTFPKTIKVALRIQKEQAKWPINNASIQW